MSFPQLKTQRLLLREVHLEDDQDLFAILSDEEVTKYYGIEPFRTKQEALKEIGWYHNLFHSKSGIRWGISFRQQRQLIGTCGFHNWSYHHNRVEIGYELSKAYWGAGIMTEALKKVIQYGFLSCRFNRIQAVVDPRNTASRSVLRKSGFVEEGLLSQYEFACGKYEDLLMLALLRRDYKGGA